MPRPRCLPTTIPPEVMARSGGATGAARVCHTPARPPGRPPERRQAKQPKSRRHGRHLSPFGRTPPGPDRRRRSPLEPWPGCPRHASFAPHLACRRRPYFPPSSWPQPRRSGRGEARRLPDHQRGAQRASSRKLRSLMTGVFAALLLVTATTASAPEAQASTTRKVVIVVGTRGLGDGTLSRQRPAARHPGAQLRRLGDIALQPLRHLVARPVRGARGEPADLPRPRQWLAQPVRAVHDGPQGRDGP